MSNEIIDVEDVAGASSFDVVVIGAGCVGACIARELSKYDGLRILMLEQEADVAQGASKANSGIVHGGYDAKGRWKSVLEREGNEMFGEVCDDLAVPFKRIGSLVLSFTERDDIELDKLMANGIKNGVRRLEFWDRERILKEEPHVSVGVRRALHCPSAGITNPYLFTIANCENAVTNGVTLRLRSKVNSITRKSTGFVVSVLNIERKFNYDIRSKRVVNCTGVFSDELSEDKSFSIKPRRGEYLLLSKEQGRMANRVLFQAPTQRWGKGVLVSPTVDGNLLLGPSASDVPERTNKSTSFQELAYVAWAARRSIPHLDTRLALRSFSGIRAKSSTGDFVITESMGFINCAGIDSPGLTSSPAIAKHVTEMMQLANKRKTNWVRHREPYERKSMSRFQETPQFSDKDPDLNIICRCEGVTESTIRDCLNRSIPITCTDSVKWRTRAGMGQCSGVRCRPLVCELIAEKTGLDATEIPKSVIGQDLPTRLNKIELGRL